MTAFLLGSSLGPVTVIMTVVASVVKKWIEETFRTRRFLKAIAGAEPPQRSEIIRACSQLENRSRPDHHQAENAGKASTSPLPPGDHNTERPEV